MRYPTAISITVLGDPTLIGLSTGCFELLAYYPIEKLDADGKIVGTVQELNTLVSGIYLAKEITHSITSGSYETVIKGIRIPSPDVYDASVIGKLMQEIEKSKPKTEEKFSVEANNKILANYVQIDLTNMSTITDDSFVGAAIVRAIMPN